MVGDRQFLDAAMASLALVATADGALSFAKRHRVDEILESTDALKGYGFHAALEAFEGFAEELRRSAEGGRAHALAVIAAAGDDAEEARVLLHLAWRAARDERGYSPGAVERIAEIARRLGQDMPDLARAEPQSALDDTPPALVVAVGNRKGGTGKSTIAVHLAVGLLLRGRRVGCIDLDGDQSTLSRYFANRAARAQDRGADLPTPPIQRIEPSRSRDLDAAAAEERAGLNHALEAFSDMEVLIVDTPGSDSHLTRLGHVNAGLLITPLNDSFLDIDVLARIDLDKRLVLSPSAYAEMVMHQIERRRGEGRHPPAWLVMRNRLSQLDSRNSREMAKLLDQLSQRMGFRLLPGISERVVFRELFYDGLTLYDLPEHFGEAGQGLSRRHARAELDELVEAVAAHCRGGAEERPGLAPTEPAAGGEATTDLAGQPVGEEPEDVFQLLQKEMRNTP